MTDLHKMAEEAVPEILVEQPSRNEFVSWVVRALAKLQAEHEAERAAAVAEALECGMVLIDKVFAFADLKKDWDSYGAQAFPPETIQLAVKVARWLGDEWKVVPCADGPSVCFYLGDEEQIIEVRTDYAAAEEKP